MTYYDINSNKISAKTSVIDLFSVRPAAQAYTLFLENMKTKTRTNQSENLK